MKATAEAWEKLPDFSDRLTDAIAYAGISPRGVCDGLAARGLHTPVSYIYKLLRGPKPTPTNPHPTPPNPTFVMVFYLAEVCQVPPQWFFEADRGAGPSQAVERYGQIARRGDLLRSLPPHGGSQ